MQLLENNPNFKLLNAACEKLKKAENKSNQAILGLGVINKGLEAELTAAANELRALHVEYSTLLEWLQLPENVEALAAFGKHSICGLLNAFFSA